MPIQRTLTNTIEGPMPVLGRGDLTADAWGRQKVVHDFSLLHGLFTFNIPQAVWYESIAGVEQPSFVNATSVNGKLHLTSGASSTILRTFRSPRYEPNRGQLYSASLIIANTLAAGIRRWGLGTTDAGMYYELDNGVLYTVRRTTIDGVINNDRTLVKELHVDTNLAMGNTFDIQFQWRGVGDSFWYAGDPDTRYSAMVQHRKYLNTSDELSVFNPALPLFFECINQGDVVTLECGCVDISTEGGKDADGTYGAIPTNGLTGRIALPGPNQYNTPVLVVHSKSNIGTLVNTRDVQNLGLTAYGDVDGVVRVWITRDPTAFALGTQTWTDFRDGNLEYVQYDPLAGTPLAFNIAKAELQYGSGIAGGIPFTSGATFDRLVQLFLSPGDYLVFTIHRDNGGAINAGLTYEFSEAI